MSTAQQRGKRSRAKGQEWERKVAAWFVDELGWSIRRRIDNTREDYGDLEGLPSWLVVDAKSGPFTPGMLTQVAQEKVTAGADVGVLFCKLRGASSPEHGFVVMSPMSFAYLLREAAGDE